MKTLKDILAKAEGDRYEASDSYSDCGSALEHFTEDMQKMARDWIKVFEKYDDKFGGDIPKLLQKFAEWDEDFCINFDCVTNFIKYIFNIGDEN